MLEIKYADTKFKENDKRRKIVKWVFKARYSKDKEGN